MTTRSKIFSLMANGFKYSGFSEYATPFGPLITIDFIKGNKHRMIDSPPNEEIQDFLQYQFSLGMQKPKICT